MQTVKIRTLVVAAALGAALLTAPTRADAQFTPPIGDGIFIGSLVVTAIPVALFGVTDIVYAAQGRLLPAGWAVAQLISGDLGTQILDVDTQI